MRWLIAATLGLLPILVQAQMTRATWDWQLSEPFDLTFDVQVYDLDPDSLNTKTLIRLTRGV